MTTTPPERHHVPAVSAAWVDYRASVTEHGPSDAWDRAVIDAVIGHLASIGEPFSANTMRDLLPPVRTCLIGARLNSAQRRGLIVRVGYTCSTLRSTKGAEVKVYQAA